MEKNVCKMTDDSIFLIDIEKILKTKAGKKYKYIPRFVVSYLKHIVHQDELNVFLKDSKNKVGVDFLEIGFYVLRNNDNLFSYEFPVFYTPCSVRNNICFFFMICKFPCGQIIVGFIIESGSNDSWIST